MKKGLFTAILGGIGLLLGLDSCKKNCIKCLTYTYTGSGMSKFRICNDQMTAAQYAVYRDTILAKPGSSEQTLCAQ